MTAESSKRTKTFPLEIEEDLHKKLKMRAIQEDKTLHSLIIETLASQVEDATTPYQAGKKESDK